MNIKHPNKGEASMYKPKHKYTDRELVYASLRDLANEIRCARRDHCEANPLLEYADRCIAEFRALWSSRHCH